MPAARRAPTSCLSLALVAGLALPALAVQDEAQELPITAITLYRSGVGSFERVGQINGDANVYLRVDQGQLNDLLKSLVVLDGGGGTVGAISYGSREPIERRLASFGVNLADNPSMAELLSRLRGARVKVATADSTATGTITSVETVQRAEGDRAVQTYAVTIFTGAGIKRIDLDNIINLEFLDEQLKNDIERALDILAQERDENIRTVEVSSTGQGERQMLVSYVHEMPVWKPAYRLVLNQRNEPILQAWAIVENTTEEDWRRIDLSLVASQPVGFTMDLQTPLFVRRPDVPVPGGMLAQPKVYSGGQSPFQDAGEPDDRRMRALSRQAPAAETASRGAGSRMLELSDSEAFFASASSMAAAVQVGESVVLRIENPIDLDRQQSAMIPVLTEKVDARKISIYTPSQGNQPMLGVELTNTTSAPLISGPVAVYDGAYAGDAMVGFVPMNAERMLAYAVDMELKAQQAQNSSSSRATYRIVNGYLQSSHVRTMTNTYTLRNEAGKERTVVIEHQPMGGWDLVEPTNGARSDDGMVRFERTVDAGKELELKVVERRTESSRYGLIDADLPNLIEQINRGAEASDDVIAALRQGASMNRKVADLKSQLERINQQVQSIQQDQARIRQNMQAIDKTTDLYRRYLETLTAQEDQLAQLATQAEQTRKAIEQAEADRRKYFEGLSVR
ncbi:hypothetical protein AY599_19995 [Leptolyngbya valderiana BDU 20041]|nr:hypothetical protein AY599_19995 [Leptolyngbya valderiana BDU 20041]